jgi:hypothetical protein
MNAAFAGANKSRLRECIEFHGSRFGKAPRRERAQAYQGKKKLPLKK